MLVLMLLGAVLTSIGLLLAIRPDSDLDPLRRAADSRGWAPPLFILTCLLVSLPLVFLSAETRFPTAIKVCGYLLAGAAVGLMFLSPKRHARLLARIFNQFKRRPRVFASALVLAGAALLFAAA